MLCPVCKAMNMVGEDFAATPTDDADTSVPLNKVKSADLSRISMGDWNEIFGKECGPTGGLVLTSTVILAGTPGAGKTTGTLSLCRTALRSNPNRCIVYIAGEQVQEEIKATCDRLGFEDEEQGRFRIIDALNEPGNIPYIFKKWKPVLGVVDSLDGLCGEDESIKLRICSDAKKHIAAPLRCPMILISHVNKGFEIAGAMKLQHAVDETLLLTGTGDDVRMLQALKNRNGPTRTIFFDMTEHGLTRRYEVADAEDDGD